MMLNTMKKSEVLNLLPTRTKQNHLARELKSQVLSLQKNVGINLEQVSQFPPQLPPLFPPLSAI